MCPIRSRTVASALVLALGLAACGTDDERAQDDAHVEEDRLAEVEQERDDARELAEERAAEIERLDREVERLEDQLAQAPEEPASPQPLRTPEGLTDQLRLHLGFGDLPEGFDPGSTGWTSFDLPTAAVGTYAEPGDAAAAVLHELEAAGLGLDVWEATARVLLDPEDQALAYAAVLSWGWADDAVIGRDVRVTLTRTDDGEWETGGAEARHHCIRGVTDDDRCR